MDDSDREEARLVTQSREPQEAATAPTPPSAGPGPVGQEVHLFKVIAEGRVILSVEQLGIKAGEALAIIGPNGAGKSTLLRTCLGLQGLAGGSVQVLDQRVDQLGGLALSRLRRRVGYVPQDLAARSEMPLTVREVVAIGRTGLAG